MVRIYKLADFLGVKRYSPSDTVASAASGEMENPDTSELQSRLSSLSVSSFPGISSKNCETSSINRLQNTDLSQSLTQDNQSKMEDQSDNAAPAQTTEEPVADAGDSQEGSSSHPGEKKALPALAAASTWTSPELKELKLKLRQEKDSMVTVYRGDIMTINVPTVPEAQRICWEFATDGYDIGFGVYFDWSPVTSRAITVHISESSDDEEEEDELEGPVVPGDVEKGSKASMNNSNLGEILPVYRQDSHLLVQGGSHLFPGEGTYLIKFDNSYSLWRNKTLYYRVYYSA